MNRLNFVGQSIISNSVYSGTAYTTEKGKDTPNSNTPNQSQKRSQNNQKYYNGQNSEQLELEMKQNTIQKEFSLHQYQQNTQSSSQIGQHTPYNKYNRQLTGQSGQSNNGQYNQDGTLFLGQSTQNTPISSYRKLPNDSHEIFKGQRLQAMNISNQNATTSPIPTAKINQMDQTATSNMSALTSSYYSSSIGQNKPPMALTNFNRNERMYFQNQNQFSQQLNLDNSDQRDISTISMNTQQRFIYSRNGSEKSISASTYYNKNQQKDFATSTKSNFESYINKNNGNDDKSRISNKYKVRSCVNMKSSTKMNNNPELTFLSQVQTVNEQILGPSNTNESQLLKNQMGRDNKGVFQGINNETPITSRKNIDQLNSTQQQNSVISISTQGKKEINNRDILVDNKINESESQIKDNYSIFNANNLSDRSSLLFQTNRMKNASETSSTLKNVFYQQLAANSHINKNRNSNKHQNKSYTNQNKKEVDLENFNNEAIAQDNEQRRRTQSKMEYYSIDSNEDSEEDRRMYEELLELSPLPKSRKNDLNLNKEGLIKPQLIQTESQYKNQSNTSNQDQFFNQQEIKKRNQQDEERENQNIENNPNYTQSSIQTDRILKLGQSSMNDTNKLNYSKNYFGGLSTPNLNNLRKGETIYNNSTTVEQQAQNTKKYANNYKKIDHIVDEVKHFNDNLEVEQAMLTTTLSKNILPRKLGIVANFNPNQKSIGDALKQRKKRQSFDANGSPLKSEQKGDLPAVLASQKGKRVSEFLPNQTDSSEEKQKAASQKQNTSTLSSNTNKIHIQPESILKRSSSQNQSLIAASKNYNNGFMESDSRKGILEKVSFKDSEEVATYLSKNLLISVKNDEHVQKQNLNLSRLQISKTYSEMLAQALKHKDFENLNSLNLQDNNLTGSALLLISNNLPQYLRKLDLSSNFLNSNDGPAICNILNSRRQESLISLNLSNNQLSDAGLKAITPALSYNSSLLSLNIIHNKLTDLSSPYLKEILLQNSTLQELYLSWNKISSKSGIDIAIGLNNNFNIKVLDLSHNCLGQSPNLHCGKKIIESCTKLESGLIHLDLSYNLFTKIECKEISAALNKNKKIYGVHFEGNECHATIDTRGFIYFPDEEQILQKHVSTHTLMRRDIKSVKCLGMNKLQNFNCNVTDNCWICDGWQEIEFEIREGWNDVFIGEPVFLHLDFEDFKPMYMDRDPLDPSRFFLRRMCPPNRKVLFFFTNPCTKLLFESSDYESVLFHVNEWNLAFYEDDNYEENVASGAQLKDQKGDEQNNNEITSAHHLQHSKQRRFNVQYLDSTITEYVVPTTVNCLKTKLHKNIHKNKGDYEAHIKCLPRQEETYYKINYTNQWHRGISLFKSYTPDSPEVEQKCFEDDWNNCKIQQILTQQDKNADLSSCKKLIIDKYPQIRVLYRYLSCFGVTNDVFCVTLNPFALFAQQSKIVDNNLMKMRDLECIFISASSKALKVKNYRAPDKALIRSEFIEAMGRLAIDKYIRNKVTKSSAEALNLLLNNQVFQKHIAEYEDPQQWRNIRFWTKQCDEMMKRYLNFIKSLWNDYADSRKGEKRGGLSNVKTMNLQEFQDMVNEFNLKDKLLTEREVVMSFCLSLMTIVDEINSDKYMAMTFVEFLEGLARLSEFKSRTPVGERDECYEVDEKVQIRLEYKIESLLECMSLQYDEVMKIKRKKQLMLQRQLSSKNNSKLQALKVRKSFIQYSQSDLEDPDKNSLNKLQNTVQKVVNSINVIKAFKDSKYELNQDESDSKSRIPLINSFSSQSEITKMQSRQLHRIDSENDEFEEDDNSFSNSHKKNKPPKRVSLIQEFNDESRPISLQNIEEQN